MFVSPALIATRRTPLVVRLHARLRYWPEVIAGIDSCHRTMVAFDVLVANSACQPYGMM